jgi:sugar (pentulose or hexulose) kinase
MAHRFGLPLQLLVVAGTSDSTAAILATGTAEPGDAVTSLGSTLVTKVVTEHPLLAPEYGVYSQPLRERWLVGGGSNSGGAVLRHYFDADRLAELTTRLDPGRPTGLDYYPLLAPGERFPVNDPTLPPRLEPRPADDARFLQAMLEGMALIEAAAYRRLAELGAPYPTRVFSVGGGAGNLVWTAIRQAALGVPILAPDQSEAAYGAALLARSAATA